MQNIEELFVWMVTLYRSVCVCVCVVHPSTTYMARQSPAALFKGSPPYNASLYINALSTFHKYDIRERMMS